MRILVAGATGFIGSNLVEELNSRGHEVVAFSRSEYSGEAESTTGDLSNQEDIEKAMEDVDVAYYLVHALESENFEEKEKRWAENFRDAAEKNSLDRIIYLGGIIPPETEDEQLSPHLRSRKKTGEILRSGEVDGTELRASIVIGKGSASFQAIESVVERFPILFFDPRFDSLCQPISVEDAVYCLAEVLEHEETRNQVYDIGGEEMSYRNLVETVADEKGLFRPSIRVPFSTGRIAAFMTSLTTGEDRHLMKELVESLEHDTVVRNNLDEVFEYDPLNVREAVRKLL